jgi:uncharacterized protein (DUF433 family)
MDDGKPADLAGLAAVSARLWKLVDPSRQCASRPTPDGGSSSFVPQRSTMGYMSEALSARLNTRISWRVRNDLDALARQRQVDESELARMLLDEGLRREKHPGIVFRSTATGRQASIEGRRLYVWQVIQTVWASDGNVDEAASYLDLMPEQVRAAVRYCAEYRDEIEGQITASHQAADAARLEWQRQQDALHP